MLKYRLLLCLLLAFIAFHSCPTNATSDSPDSVDSTDSTNFPDSPGSPGFKQFDFKFFYPGTNMMTLGDIVSLVELALSQNKTIKMKVVSSDAPISFTIKNCNEVILEMDIASRSSELYFGVYWMNYLVYSGRRRCSREEYDFTLLIKTAAGTTGYFRFKIQDHVQTFNVDSFDGQLQIQQKKWEVKKYSLNLQELLNKALTKPNTKSLFILLELNSNKLELKFSKCDLNPKMLSMDRLSPAILDSEFIFQLEVLSELKCKEDSHDGRVDITIFSEDQALNGTLLFHVVDHTGFLDYLLFGSLLVVVFAASLSVSICCGIYFAWRCKRAGKARYVKKNPLLMRPLPATPVEEEIEMVDFIPKFITLSYHSEDYSNGSSENIYQSID